MPRRNDDSAPDEAAEGQGWTAGGFLTGLVLGAAAGAAVALLFAPASGEETRRIVGRRVQRLRRSAKAEFKEKRELARKEIRRRRRELGDRLTDAAERAEKVLGDVKDRMS